MKRKTVLRILSCALACVMLFETPLQASELSGDSEIMYTDESGETNTDTPSDQKEDSEGTETDTDNPDGNIEQTGESEEGSEELSGADGQTQTEPGSGETTPEEGDNDSAPQDDGTGQNGSSGENLEDGGMLDVQQPADGLPVEQQPENSLSEGNQSPENSLPIDGQQPEILSDSFVLSFEQPAEEVAADFTEYETVMTAVAEAWTNGTVQVDLSDAALSRDLVQELLEYMVQQPEYDSSCLRPEVIYTYILEEETQSRLVQTVDFSYLVLEAPKAAAEVHDFTGIQLSWSAVEGASSYEVYRAEVQDEGAAEEELIYQTEENSGETSYKDQGVSYGKTYIYQIKAVCAENGRIYRSAFSEAAEILAEADAPEGLNASAGGNVVELSWSQVEGATGYEVEALDSASGEYTFLGSTGETSYVHEELDYDASYNYRVRAVYQKQRSGAAYSAYSDAVEVRTETPVLDAVALSASPAAWNQIVLTWKETDSSAGYELERKADNGSYSKIADIQAGVGSYTDLSVEPGVQYGYRIRPVKQLGVQVFYGEYSAEQTVQTVLNAPVADSVRTSDAQSLTVSWEAVEGAGGYELYRSVSSGNGYVLAANLSNGQTEYRDTGLAVGSTYYYKVRAYYTVNGRTVYSEDSAAVSGMVKLSQVTGLRVQMTKYNTLQLNWNAVGDARTYEVYYSTSPDSGYKRATSTKKTTYKFTKAKCGQTYYFKIRTHEKIGKVKYYSDYCAAVSGKTVLVGTPTVYVSKTKYNSVTIKWSKVPSTKKYEIYYSTSPDGEYTLLKSQGGTSYTHKKLTTGVTYYYKVRPIRDYFYGEYSNVTSAKPVLDELKNLKVKTGTNQLKVSWKSVSGAQAYVLMRSDSADGDYVEISRAKKTSYTDKGLQAGTTYYYKVYAIAGIYQTNTLGPVGQATKPPKLISPPSKPPVEKDMYYGVDVSSYQGTIDWEEVADSGIDFAMIRILTGKRTSNLDKDTKFEYNYRNAREAGIKVGVYRYTYATTKSGARQEATEIVDALGGRYLEYPIVLDLEDSTVLNRTTREKRTEIIQEYKKIVERAGYKFALYANKNWLENYIEPEALEDVDIWLARWRSLDQGPGYSGPGNLTMWQYTSTGSVAGISGNVDRNVSYKNYK